jgi:tRNA U34 2-thiouridine synthase MnmA/TrmU
MIMDFKKEDLKYLEFPLGKYLKTEVRCIAENYNIEQFNKKESM